MLVVPRDPLLTQQWGQSRGSTKGLTGPLCLKSLWKGVQPTSFVVSKIFMARCRKIDYPMYTTMKLIISQIK